MLREKMRTYKPACVMMFIWPFIRPTCLHGVERDAEEAHAQLEVAGHHREEQVPEHVAARRVTSASHVVLMASRSHGVSAAAGDDSGWVVAGRW